MKEQSKSESSLTPSTILAKQENKREELMNEKPVGKYISVLYRKFQVKMNKSLKPYGVNSSQYIFLLQLYKTNHVSQEFLSKNLHIDKSATARAICQLQEGGFVKRSVNKEDKRSYIVSLTDKSEALRPVLHQILSEWNREITKNFTDEQYLFLYDALEQMSKECLAIDLD